MLFPIVRYLLKDLGVLPGLRSKGLFKGPGGNASLPGLVLPWVDVLHEGPVPALPPDKLRAVRARFLRGTYGSGSSTISTSCRRVR